MKKKSQAAFEFLVNYLWAFLVIVVIVGTLIYFTSDVTKQLPDTCTLGNTHSEAFSISGSNNGNNVYDNISVAFQSRNSISDKIEIKNITYEYEDQELNIISCSSLNQEVAVGGLIDIRCIVDVTRLNINVGEAINLKTKVSYTIKGEIFTKYLIGEIQTSITDTESISPQPCSDNNECGGAGTCISQICTSLSDEGGQCDDNDNDDCIGTLICSADNKCMRPVTAICLKGNDCVVGGQICVDTDVFCSGSATCQHASSSYDGRCCSDDFNSWTNDGIITRDSGGTWECDETESSYDGSDYYDACSSTDYGAPCDSASLAGGYSVEGVCGDDVATHDECYTVYASDTTSSITASSVFGIQAAVCDDEDNYYCDDISDGSFSPGDKRCDADDNYCDACDNNYIGDDLDCEEVCGASSECDELDPNGWWCDGNHVITAECQGTSDCVYSDSGGIVGLCEITDRYDSNCGGSSACDGQAPSSDLNACDNIGQTYFADYCNSACGVTDNTSVCRSSVYDVSCTADSGSDDHSPDTCDSTTAYINSTCAYWNVADDLNYACGCIMTGTKTYIHYWNIGGETNASVCCENTIGEYVVYENYNANLDPPPSEKDDACCSHDTDCNHENTCYNDGYNRIDIDNDNDNDSCNAGQWVDCEIGDQCNSTQECKNNNCVDISGEECKENLDCTESKTCIFGYCESKSGLHGNCDDNGDCNETLLICETEETNTCLGIESYKPCTGDDDCIKPLICPEDTCIKIV